MLNRIAGSDNQRSELVKINILLGAGIRGVSILVSLLLVPLTISYISSELYGIWLTLSSIIHWIGFFDIGFGNGLRNKLTESIALGNFKKGKIYVSTTYMLMFCIFATIGLLSSLGASYVNWSSLLNVPQQYNTILINVAQILFVAFSLQMILKLIQNVIQAYQLNALASFLDTLGNILSLIFIYVLTKTMAPDLKYIAWSFSLAPVLVLALASIILYGGKFRQVAPDLRFFKRSFVNDIFNLGGKFFIIQISGLVLYQMINILISRICGPEQVTNYNVAYKYLSVPLMVINIIMAPLWSAFTDAYVKKDVTWMFSIYRRLIKIFCVTIVGVVIMVVVSPFVYRWWVGDNVNITIYQSILVGTYVLIAVWGNIHGTLINGMGKVWFQVYYSLAIMALFIPLTLVLGHTFDIYGILLAMILVNVPGFICGRYQVIRLINGTAVGIWNK